MRHRMGNSPKCIECYYYREKEDGDGCKRDGWCVNPYQCSHGINGRKLEHPQEKKTVLWNERCHCWEDAEDRLTSYEVECRRPEPGRTEAEKIYITELLNGKGRTNETKICNR